MNHTSKRFIDLSHTLEAGMITYKGLPAPLICDFLSREDSQAHYADNLILWLQGRCERASHGKASRT